MYTARAALITVPLGVLQQSLSKTGVRINGGGSGFLLPHVEGAATLEFHPPLPPSHTTAIATLGMGLLNKYIMEWGGDGVPAAAAAARMRELVPKGVEMLESCSGTTTTTSAHFPELVVLGHHAPQHANALMAFSAGSQSLALGRVSEKESQGQKGEGAPPAAAAALLAHLRTMLGPTLPPPTTFTATRWEADPFACGSYSFLPPGVSPAQRDALAQSVGGGVLWFAGEHTCGDHPSTVHGAMLSGRRAAASMAKELKGGCKGGGGGRAGR